MNASRRASRALLDEVYATLPFTPVKGEGVYIEDAAGRRVLDLYGGHAVAVLGYGHPRLTAAIERQARELLFQSNAVPLAIRDRAADRLAEFAPGGVGRVFFVNSGAEANENALRLSLKLTGRSKIVAVEHGFHGRTAAAAAVTWGAREKWYAFPRTPMDVVFVPRDDAAALEASVDADTAAIILEPVQGLAGAYELAPTFLAAARQAADGSGALLILDEVQTGMGRLGEAFGAQLYGITPDILTTAKGLAGGLPAGAVLTTPEIAAELAPGDLGTTFGGGPVACAAIVAVVETIVQDDLLARVRSTSAQLRRLAGAGPVIGVQGAGLLLGLRTRAKAAAVRDALLERDILTGTSADPQILRLLPPLILEDEHVQILTEALGELTDASL
jgi:acetylornithine/succinyldiaminopimelate/putrescine aminotransferase